MWFQLAIIVNTLQHVLAADQRPKGVGPEFATHYASKKQFACIANPSITLPSARVNDNFCDCPDGSDEPGTSACAHLAYRSLQPYPAAGATNNTLALPGFYCKNKHHNPSYLPFTHVGDGICDYTLCCDGSDEAPGTCPDKCKEIGKQWRADDEKRQLSLSAAAKLRIQLVADAATKRKELEDWIRDHESEIGGLEAKVKAAEEEKNEMERIEKMRVVRKPVSAGKAGVLAQLAREKITQWKDSLTYMRQRRDQERGRANELERILATFKEEYNPNFNDEGVKRAVRAFEEYAAREKAVDNDAGERDIDTLFKETDGEGGIQWSEFETPEQVIGDIETLYSFEQYLPDFVQEWVDGRLRALRVFLVQNGILAEGGSSGGGEESQELRDSRQRLNTAQNDLSSLQRKKTEQEEDLKRDFGPNDVFRPMKDKCLSLDSGEYTYELCWLGQVTQKPKKGGMHNNMGRFGHFLNVTVDEDVGADGKGLGSGERLAMRHENGATCWQGPARSTTVIMACSEEEAVWKVMEEEKCVYRLEVGTPAVCAAPEGLEKAAKKGHVKDELRGLSSILFAKESIKEMEG